MMYIASQNNAPHGAIYEHVHHISEAKPNIKIGESVIRVQADGDEVDYIHRHFSNIPFANKRVVIWTGAFAQFIYDNL